MIEVFLSHFAEKTWQRTLLKQIINSLKRYTYLKFAKFSASIQVKGRWTVFTFPAMQIFPFLTKNRGMFQKKIAYFKYTLQLASLYKKIKRTFHWQPIRSLRARQSRNELWYTCFSFMLFILIILFFYFSYSCCIFYSSSILLTQTLIWRLRKFISNSNSNSNPNSNPNSMLRDSLNEKSNYCMHCHTLHRQFKCEEGNRNRLYIFRDKF